MLHESIMVPSFSAISDNAIAIYLDNTAIQLPKSTPKPIYS